MYNGRVSAAKLLRVLIVTLGVVAAAVTAAYIGFTYWVDTGEISISGADRREGVFTLLIAATDEDGTRTDSIMVATFDMQNGTADVVNIPRDTLVDTERTGTGKKINAAYAEGIDELKAEIKSVIGYEPDKYIVMDFDSIASIIDAVGGIDYRIPFKMSYHDASQGISIEFKKGRQHLNGQQAVEFLRWRHNDNDSGYEDGDVGRVKKLQKFMKKLAKQVLKPQNVLKLPGLASSLSSMVDTDLTASQLLWMGTQCMSFDMKNDVTMQTLAGDSAEIDINMGYYLWYYVVDKDMALEQINDGLDPFTGSISADELEIETPYTIDGAYSPNWLDEMAYRYSQAGLEYTEPKDERYSSDYGDDYYNDYETYEDGGEFYAP